MPNPTWGILVPEERVITGGGMLIWLSGSWRGGVVDSGGFDRDLYMDCPTEPDRDGASPPVSYQAIPPAARESHVPQLC